MSHKINEIKALDDLALLATFKDGTIKKYEIKQLYDSFPQFKDMEKDKNLFNQVQIDVGGYGISWNDYFDLDSEEIWENGIEIGKQTDIDSMSLLAAKLSEARESVGMTQKDLAEKTGIYQSDISKIERGLGNPSIQTLDRLAEGLNLKLEINFKSKL